jgi:hypothetical protein
VLGESGSGDEFADPDLAESWEDLLAKCLWVGAGPFPLADRSLVGAVLRAALLGSTSAVSRVCLFGA